MLTRSKAFDQAIATGATVEVQAVVTSGGAPIAPIDFLPGASVSMDETAAARRTLSATVADDGTGTYRPLNVASLLAPFSNELVVSSGLVIPSTGAAEMLQIGVFRLQTNRDDSTGLITLTGVDRSVLIAQNLNESPYTIYAGTPLDVAIGAYLTAKYPSVVFVPDAAAHGQIIATTTVYGAGTTDGDPWANCITIAAAFGRELFFDNLGRCVLQLIPDPSTYPICWHYVPGTANMGMSSTHTVDTTNVVNVVVASSSSSTVSPPVTATVEITDQTSPVYPSPTGFGRRQSFVSSTLLTTTLQCQTFAQGVLNKQQGIWESNAFTAIPHPAHVPGDVVEYASALTGVDVSLVLSSWKLQLDLQTASSYTTRQVAGTYSQST